MAVETQKKSLMKLSLAVKSLETKSAPCGAEKLMGSNGCTGLDDPSCCAGGPSTLHSKVASVAYF